MGNDVTNIILVGVGGQGIILASEVLSEVALLAGYDIRKSEVHGMAQRGGSVSSHVRFGKDVKSPLIERRSADYMLAFEQAEGIRFCEYLSDGATIIMNDVKIIPTTVSIGMGSYPDDIPEQLRELGFNLVLIDAESLAKQAGIVKAANIALMASLASFLTIEKDIWEEVIRRRVPQKFIDSNMEAFRLGYAASVL